VEASGINNLGQVIGNYSATASSYGAFITGPNGIGMSTLGSLGGSSTVTKGINDSGQVVGWSYLSGNSTEHAFITGANGVGMNDLGTLGGSRSDAYSINNSGQVVGMSYKADGSADAFITGANGVGMTAIGTPGGMAQSINDLGQVVGVWASGNGTVDSFLYSSGVITDLSLLDPVVSAGWTNLWAWDINNNGQIVGQGTINGMKRAFLLSGALDGPFPEWHPPESPPPITGAVPEPETYAMMLAGLGLLGFMARRRKQKAA
jgi:probable HAF family extracellular repeat protein